VNVAAVYLYHLLVDSPRKWHPLIGFYYLTYACRFRCPYCSDGSGRPYHKLISPVLAADRVLALLRVLRRHCDHLVLTGGEPLEHPEFAQVMQGLPALRFRKVLLTTNGDGLGTSLPAVAGAVDELIFSLDTLDAAKADDWYGLGRGTLARILGEIEQAARHPRRRFTIIISSVVTPHNIADLYEVYEYCRQRGFRLAACPQLVGVHAHAALWDNPAYREFYDFLITEKRRAGHVQGTVGYLECLRDLRPFQCRPFTMLVVSPTGDVFYPCLEIGHVAGNLFEETDLHRLRRQGYARFGPQPNCGNQCHSACAAGFASLLSNPASLLHEGWLQIRGRVKIRNPK
jgi:MoaA/NifB/PqqE/SkfB family radical SAM enzyme